MTQLVVLWEWRLPWFLVFRPANKCLTNLFTYGRGMTLCVLKYYIASKKCTMYYSQPSGTCFHSAKKIFKMKKRFLLFYVRNSEPVAFTAAAFLSHNLSAARISMADRSSSDHPRKMPMVPPRLDSSIEPSRISFSSNTVTSDSWKQNAFFKKSFHHISGNE